MPTLNKLLLKDHFLYRNFEWQIDEYKLCTIRGKNLDRADDSGNAVGKSMLPSVIPNILYDAPPTASKKKSSKEGMSSKTDDTLTVGNTRGLFDIRQYMQGQSVKLSISKDGTDTKIYKKADNRKEIESIFPMTEESFYSQVYLNRNRQPVLLTGKADTRLKFFEEAFDQRIYGTLKKIWSKKLSEISKVSGSYKTLIEQRESLRDAVDDSARGKLKKIKGRYEDLNTRYRTTNHTINKLTSYVTLQGQLESNATTEELEKELASCQSKQKSLKQEYKKAARDLENNEANKAIEAKRKKISDKLKSLKAPKDIKNQKVRLKKLYALLDKESSMRELYDSYEYRIEDFKSREKTLNPAIRKRMAKYTVKGLESKIAKKEYELESKENLTPGKPCPMCGSKVSHKHADNLALIKKDLISLHDLLEVVQNIEAADNLKKEIPAKVLSYSPTDSAKRIKKYKRGVENLENEILAYREYKELKERLTDLPKVSVNQEVSQGVVDKLWARLEKCTDRINTIENDLRLMSKLKTMDIGLPVKEAKKSLKEKQEWVDKITPKLDNLSSKIDSLYSRAERSKVSSEQIAAISKQLDEMEGIMSDKVIYEELVRACSHKGLIILETQSLVAEYINKLNKLAKVFYLEPISFEAIVDINKFDIIGHRSGGPGDIRSLSGSERSQFIPISALALTSLMPSDQRCNVMIMDELEEGMSEPEMRVFGEHFIPRVSEAIPNTVVITPNNQKDFSIPMSVERLLIKKGNETRWAENW